MWPWIYSMKTLDNHPWEIIIQFCNWLALKFSVKWKWTMLRDRNISYGQSKLIDKLGSHQGNIKFQENVTILIVCHGLGFALDEPKIISSRPWTIIRLVPCSSPCRYFIHLEFHWPLMPLGYSLKWTWTLSGFFINHKICIWQVKGSQALSVHNKEAVRNLLHSHSSEVNFVL
jgi:hypothetical protein